MNLYYSYILNISDGYNYVQYVSYFLYEQVPHSVVLFNNLIFQIRS